MRGICAVTAVVAAALLLGGCTAQGSMQSAVEPQYASSEGLRAADMASSAASDSGATESGATVTDRQVITTGTISLTVDEPVKSADSAVAIIEQAGGHIAERTEQPATDTQKASAHLVLRIPSDTLTATVAKLKKLGRVNNASFSASDVTTTVQDLDARITALETSVNRLLTMMSNATDTTDLIAIETALSERQANLESLQSQRAYLGDQVSLSTVTLDLVSEGTVAAAAPQDFWAGLAAGWNALLVAAAGLLVGFGVALPWLVVLGVIAAIVWLALRPSRRRKQLPNKTSA